jgi:hypothetical protein
MDIEDAFKLRLLTCEETIGLLLNFFDDEKLPHIKRIMDMVDDVNEKIAYLRSSIIGLLVDECSRVFLENEEELLEGTFNTTLIKQVNPKAKEAYAVVRKQPSEKYTRRKRCSTSNWPVTAYSGT